MRTVVRNKRIPARAKIKCTITDTSKNVPGLPSEIWEKIAFFACTDLGKTAAVLLRVSRTVAQGAELHAYTVVTLIGPRSITSFRNDIARHRNRRARVRALFVAEKDEGGRDVLAVIRERKEMAKHLRPLLMLVSSSLKSLALINFIPRALSSVPLPALRSLTIRGPGYHTIEDICALYTLTHLHVHVHDRYGFKLFSRANPLEAIPIATTRMPSIECVTLSMTKSISQAIFYLATSLQKERAHCFRDRTSNAQSNRPVRFTVLDNSGCKRTGVACYHVQTRSDVQFKERLEREAGEGWDFRIIEMPEPLKKDTPEGWRTFWLEHVLHDLYAARSL
jgi:hypothetical protein